MELVYDILWDLDSINTVEDLDSYLQPNSTDVYNKLDEIKKAWKNAYKKVQDGYDKIILNNLIEIHGPGSIISQSIYEAQNHLKPITFKLANNPFIIQCGYMFEDLNNYVWQNIIDIDNLQKFITFDETTFWVHLYNQFEFACDKLTSCSLILSPHVPTMEYHISYSDGPIDKNELSYMVNNLKQLENNLPESKMSYTYKDFTCQSLDEYVNYLMNNAEFLDS